MQSDGLGDDMRFNVRPKRVLNQARTSLLPHRFKQTVALHNVRTVHAARGINFATIVSIEQCRPLHVPHAAIP